MTASVNRVLLAVTLGLGLPLGLACDRGPDPEVELAGASSEVTFASVEMIGPHHYLASIRRADVREGGEDLLTDEIVEISWQDWDNFQSRRLVDGEVQRETIVSGGRTWVRSGQVWDERDDAEPHRVQLRTVWNAWDEVLGTHSGHINLVPDGDDIVEGRPASRYRVELLPEDQAPRPRSWGFQPVSLSGTLWLDKASAVRLKADVEAVSTRQRVTRTVNLTLERSNIGEDQGIQRPQN